MVTATLTVMIQIVLDVEAVLKRQFSVYVKPLEYALRAFCILDGVKVSRKWEQSSSIVSVIYSTVFTPNKL